MTGRRFTNKISGTIFLIVFFLSGTLIPISRPPIVSMPINSMVISEKSDFPRSLLELGTSKEVAFPDRGACVSERSVWERSFRNADWGGALFAAEVSDNVRTASAEKVGITVRAELMPKEPFLTDDLTMTLWAEHLPEYNFRIPDWGSKYGDFEVLETLPTENTISNGRQITQYRIRLRPVRSGTLSLPPIPLMAVKNGSDDKVSLLIPPGKIEIRSDYENKTADLGDIREPFGIIKRHAPMILLATVVLLLSVTALIFILKRKKASAQIVEPVIPPSERALSELQQLMDKKVYVQDVREFYLRITGIVRWFIEQTTGLRAPEQTTEEFLTSLARDRNKNGIFSKSMKDHLKNFLEFSDLVKFAKFRPTLDEIFDAYHNAKFVIETPVMQTSEEESSEHVPEHIPNQGGVQTSNQPSTQTQEEGPDREELAVLTEASEKDQDRKGSLDSKEYYKRKESVVTDASRSGEGDRQ